MTDDDLPTFHAYRNHFEFTKYGDDSKWHVVGPESVVPKSKVVKVYRFATDTVEHVCILDVVAYREVRRASGKTEKYIIATFENVVEED